MHKTLLILFLLFNCLVETGGRGADLTNAAISVGRGDFVGAGINVIAIVPGIGDGVKASSMAIKTGKAASALTTVTKHADETIDAGIDAAKHATQETTNVVKTKPLQNHHVGTIYGENGKRLQTEIDKYGLKLDGEWNKEMLPHLGRHTQEYHDEVYRLTQQAAKEAGDDVGKFLELYEKYVKSWVRQNPGVMYKSPKLMIP